MEVEKTPIMNYVNLRKYIKSKGMTFKEYASVVLNIKPQTIDYKFRGKSSFTAKQIELTKKYFNLTNKQVVDFFFEQ